MILTWMIDIAGMILTWMIDIAGMILTWMIDIAMFYWYDIDLDDRY
jgi:hypothetical protein